MTQDGDNGLRISGLRKSYGERTAVDGIDLEAPLGSITGIIGPDGAGKTTTMRIVCGLLLPDSGCTEVMGFDPVTQHKQVRERIGYMPQRFSLYPDLTVQENLRFFADLYGVSSKEYVAREPELMQFSRLGSFRNRRASALSGGMKQKLALICTLIHTPQVLVLDEPTFGVDPVSRKEFWNILRNLANDGLSLLVSTAYMDEAGLCDHLALMHKGKIVQRGTPDEVINAYPRRLLEIVGKDPTILQRHLRSRLSSHIEIHRFGDRLHIAYDTANDEANLTSLMRELNVEGKEIRPSVEDVFVALASREEVAA
ncbi:MAG: ABC transporter ATP-binding protein [bacterium]